MTDLNEIVGIAPNNCLVSIIPSDFFCFGAKFLLTRHIRLTSSFDCINTHMIKRCLCLIVNFNGAFEYSANCVAVISKITREQSRIRKAYQFTGLLSCESRSNIHIYYCFQSHL